METDTKGVVIDERRLYDLHSLRRMGFGAQALRTMRRKHGLIVHRCGRKSWVEGQALIGAIKSAAVVA